MPHNVSFYKVLTSSCGLRHRHSQSHCDGTVTTTETHARRYEGTDSQQLIMPRGRVTGNIQKVLQEAIFFGFLFLINLFILFIYFWLCWVFVAAHGLSLVVASGGYSSLRCAGFSLRWLLLLQSTGSRCAGFSSCGAWAQ